MHWYTDIGYIWTMRFAAATQSVSDVDWLLGGSADEDAFVGKFQTYSTTPNVALGVAPGGEVRYV